MEVEDGSQVLIFQDLLVSRQPWQHRWSRGFARWKRRTVAEASRCPTPSMAESCSKVRRRKKSPSLALDPKRVSYDVGEWTASPWETSQQLYSYKKLEVKVHVQILVVAGNGWWDGEEVETTGKSAYNKLGIPGGLPRKTEEGKPVVRAGKKRCALPLPFIFFPQLLAYLMDTIFLSEIFLLLSSFCPSLPAPVGLSGQVSFIYIH